MRWTNSEERTLREIYPTGTPDEITTAIPKHSREAIHARAHCLGVRRERFRREAPGICGVIMGMRAQRGLTQRALAEMAGIDRSHLARLEAGGKIPSLPTLNLICEALGLELVAIPKTTPAE